MKEQIFFTFFFFSCLFCCSLGSTNIIISANYTLNSTVLFPGANVALTNVGGSVIYIFVNSNLSCNCLSICANCVLYMCNSSSLTGTTLSFASNQEFYFEEGANVTFSATLTSTHIAPSITATGNAFLNVPIRSSGSTFTINVNPGKVKKFTNQSLPPKSLFTINPFP